MLLTMKDVLERVPLTRQSIYRLMARGKFPRPLKIGLAAVRWKESDIDQWFQTRPEGGGGRKADPPETRPAA